MTDPCAQALYVMQSEHGFLKIGRSLNPEKRRQTLESTEKCRMALVWVGSNMGHLEEEIHRRLAEYRVEGEWFLGDEASKVEVLNAIRCQDTITWPFEYNQESATTWLEAWADKRYRSSVRRTMHRMIDLHILSSENPDDFIPWFLHHAGAGPSPTWQGQRGTCAGLQGWQEVHSVPNELHNESRAGAGALPRR